MSAAAADTQGAAVSAQQEVRLAARLQRAQFFATTASGVRGGNQWHNVEVNHRTFVRPDAVWNV